MAKLNTTTPSGFPEFSPAEQRVVRHWKKTIAEIFEKHGFPLIETPLVERTENFEAKGGNPKEIYVLDRLHSDSADQDSAKSRAIRFDHTVPLALFVARNFNDLAFPFRRSVIGPVMRGERAQKGRFRQFDQCDIDVIGNGSLSLANDAQMVVIIAEIFAKLMPEQKFVIRINNRKILTGIANFLGIEPRKYLEVIDQKDKVSADKHKQMLKELCPDEDQMKMFFEKGFKDKNFNESWGKGKIEECFNILKNSFGELNEECLQGINEMEEVCKILFKNFGISHLNCIFDYKIARGLDYYTGTVYETNLLNEDGSINTSLGSICSGGRYDDLAGVFTGKDLPGVGISIGLTRLLWQLFDAKIIEPKQSSSSEAIILFRSPELLSKAIKIGQKLREKNIAIENYFEPKKIQKQFAYADKMGIPVRVIVGEKDIVVENRGNSEELKAKIEAIL